MRFCWSRSTPSVPKKPVRPHARILRIGTLGIWMNPIETSAT